MLGDELAVALLVVVLGEVAGELGLLAQAFADLGQVRRWVVDRAEVGEGEALGLPAFDDSDRVLPGLDVDVGRRRGGDDQVDTRDARTAATSPTKAVPLSSCR